MTQEKTNTQIYKLENKPIGALLREYAVPAVVGTMVNSLYNIVDRIFIGNGVSSLAISGLAVTFPIFIFIQAFSMLVGAGASARISILLGQKKRSTAEELLGNAFILTLILSTTTITLSMIFMDSLLLSFGASENTLFYAKEYLMIALPGNIFANVSFSYNNVMRASGYPKKAMTTMLIGAIVNTVLDAIFIYGFNLGIRGAAWATVIAMFTSMVFVLSHFIKSDSVIKMRVRNFKLKKKHILGIASIGMAPFAMQLTSSLVSVIFNKSLSHYGGDYAVGAYGITNSFSMLVVMLCVGIAQGMQPIVGFNFGANRIDRVKETVFKAGKINFFIGLFGALLGVFAPQIIAGAFTNDAEMIEITSFAIRCITFTFAGVAVQITITQYFQSIGKAKMAMFLSLSRQFLFLIPSLLILPRFFELHGVWYASPVSDIFSIVVACILFYHHYKKYLKPHLVYQEQAIE